MAETANPTQTSTDRLKWLDDLEKEFDKAFVELDLMVGEIDSDQAELAYDCRQKMVALSSVFAQMVCKCQTLAQKNTKLTVGTLFIFVCLFERNSSLFVVSRIK